MAAIDKFRTNSPSTKRQLIEFFLTYKPQYLRYIYDPFESELEFTNRQKDLYYRNKESIIKQFKNYPTAKVFIDNHSKFECYDPKNNEELEEEWIEYVKKPYDKVISDDEYAYMDTTLIVMNCPCSVDRWLKWFCPIYDVREYLHNQCGVKTRWYHKLFFKK